MDQEGAGGGGVGEPEYRVSRTYMSSSLYMTGKCGIGKIPGARFS